MHAALADPARLAITDTLADGDASPSELAGMLAMPSNLLAHHLKVLEETGLVTRHRSEGDRRRIYLRLVPGALDTLAGPPALGRAAGAVRVHRQLRPLPPGRRAVAAGEHGARGLGRHPPGRQRSPREQSTLPGAATCRCPGSGPGTSATSSTTATWS